MTRYHNLCIYLLYHYHHHFSPDYVCLLDELQLFLDSPIEYYNINTVDLFLYRLSNVFQVDVLVIKSNTEDCWFEDLTGNNNENPKKNLLRKDFVTTH